MLDELKALTAARAGHNAAMNVGAGVLGSRILQILEVTAAVVVPPPPKKSIFSRAVSPAPGALHTVLPGPLRGPRHVGCGSAPAQSWQGNAHAEFSLRSRVIARLSFGKASKFSTPYYVGKSSLSSQPMLHTH